MPQAVRIFVFVCITFLVYITSRGELSKYLGFFKLGSTPGSDNGQSVLEGYGRTTNTITEDAETVKRGVETAYQGAEAVSDAAKGLATAYTAVTASNGSEIASGENQIADAIAAASVGGLF